jgi:hypothetical protein
MFKSRRVRLVEHAACNENIRKAYIIEIIKPEWRRPLAR